MPYSNARYYMFVVIAVIGAGFWPSYFSVGTNVPWQFHAHGVAASIWVLMVLTQTWTVHKAQLPLHRAVGKTSLLLFPFLIGGLAAIIDLTGKGFVAHDSPVRTALGGAFLIGLALAIAAYVTLYYRALKFRRKVWLHSGYMLATPLILFESPFSRAASFVFPPFHVNGPAEFPKIMASIEWSMAIELAIIAVIWWRVGERARPFLVTAGLIVVEMLAMGLASNVPALRQVDSLIGHLPHATIILTGFAIGALTSWAGWNAGKRPTVPVAAAQPA